MTRRAWLIAWCATWLLAAACSAETARERVRVPLSGRGGAAEPFEVGGFTVTLEDARIGLGPIYFCASTASSSERCPAAVAELTDSVLLDALDPEPQALGELDAITVAVRSAALDYAITWPTSADAPSVLDAAPDGHSAVFAGRAENGTSAFSFGVRLDVTPGLRGTHAASGLPARGDIHEGSRCELALDPAAAFAQVDFEELAALGAETIDIAPGSRAYEALIVALTSSTPPTFRWSEP